MADEFYSSLNGFGTDKDVPFVSKLLYQLIEEKYKPLLDESSDLMCITDRDGKFIYVNKKLMDSLSYTKKELLTMHIMDVVASESRSEFSQNMKEFLRSGRIKIGSFVLKTKLGGKVYGEMNSMAFYDNEGKYCGAKAVFRDRTGFLEMERLEKKYESVLEDGINTLDYVIFIVDKDCRIKWVSSSAQKYFGLNKSESIGDNIKEVFKDRVAALIRDRDIFLKHLFSIYEYNIHSGSFECEVFSLSGGDNYLMEHWSYPILQGELNGGRIEIFHDVTLRKKSEETLEYYYKKIHAIMEHAVEGIVELHRDSTIQFVNKSFLDKLGYSEMEMLRLPLTDFIIPEDRMKLVSVKLIRKAREITFACKDGSRLYCLVSSIPLVFGSMPPHALCFISDITEAKLATQKLKDANLTLRALNDSLLDLSLRDVRTGTYNYRYLGERLGEEIKRARRYLRPFSLIMIDLDFFKSVNDTYGHGFGDTVLSGFAALLLQYVRQTDVVVRSGGEEFVIFCPDTDAFGAKVVAEKIARQLKEESLGDGQRRVSLTASMGIASYPESGVEEACGLLDAADQAMYQSKEAGRNRITVFSSKSAVSRPAEKERADFTELDSYKQRLANINLRNEESILESLRSMVYEVGRREGYPQNLQEDVAVKVQTLAKSFGLSTKQLVDVRRAALLSNVGLLSVPKSILLKKEPLTSSEREMIRLHPLRSSEVLSDFSFLAPLSRLVLYHHERYDGGGYPFGLKGEDIPLETRMISIAETFQALISSRPYREKSYSSLEALRLIQKEAGRQFDPFVVEHFVKCF